MAKKIDKQQDYFNNLSDQYVAGNELNFELLKTVKKLTSKYIKGDILDIGSGGIISFEHQKAKTITLTDIAEKLIKSPKILEDKTFKSVKSKNIKSLKASAMDLPFKKESFDVVLMFNVAHHLSVNNLSESKDNVQIAFKEVNRVLKKDGIFIFLDNFPTLLFKVAQELSYETAYWLLLKFLDKPLPYFLSERQAKNYLIKNNFNLQGVKKIKWPERVYQPLFPLLSPPGWLWEKILKNRMYILKK